MFRWHKKKKKEGVNFNFHPWNFKVFFFEKTDKAWIVRWNPLYSCIFLKISAGSKLKTFPEYSFVSRHMSSKKWSYTFSHNIFFLFFFPNKKKFCESFPLFVKAVRILHATLFYFFWIKKFFFTQKKYFFSLSVLLEIKRERFKISTFDGFFFYN